MPAAALQDPESQAPAAASEPAPKPAAKPRSRAKSPRAKAADAASGPLLAGHEPVPAAVASAPTTAEPAAAALALYAQVLAATSAPAAAHRVAALLSHEQGFSR